MFGLTMHEGAAMLGEAAVYADGSWLADVPPYIPIHLQPIDKFGMAIRNQGLWIQASRREPALHRLPREPHRHRRPVARAEPHRR